MFDIIKKMNLHHCRAFGLESVPITIAVDNLHYVLKLTVYGVAPGSDHISFALLLFILRYWAQFIQIKVLLRNKDEM